jgi:hypothetical protein
VGTSAARVWGTRGADHHHRSSIVRERGARGAPRAGVRLPRRRAHLGRACDRVDGGRTSGLRGTVLAHGAPRASTHPHPVRAHPSRFVISNRDIESQIQIVCCARTRGPKRRRAAWSSRGGPSVRDVWLHVTRVGDLRRYRYRAASGRRTRNDGPRMGSRRSPFPTGYVQLVSTRDELRTMKRITVRERSVKRFIAKIHNLAQRLLFRHRGELSSATTVIGADIASST